MNDVVRRVADDEGEAVRVLALAGIPLIASRNISEDRFRAVEQAFWQGFEGSRELKTAILLRIRALSEVLGSRRLNKFVSDHNSGMLRMTSAFCSGPMSRAYITPRAGSPGRSWLATCRLAAARRLPYRR